MRSLCRVRQKNGKWWVFIDHHGKRKAKCIGEKRTAQHVAEQLRAKLALGQFEITDAGAKEQYPFSVYYKEWLESYVRNNTKDATYISYELAYRMHFLPLFGDKDIRTITRAEVKQFIYDKLKAGLARNSVRGYLAPLREMLNHAMEDGHLDRNPCQSVMRTIRAEHGERKERINFLRREEVAYLLEAFQQHFSAHFPFVLLLVRTGLRLGEAVSLQWGDIDFHDRFIEVRRNLSKGKLQTPKSGKWRRVDMSLQLTETLKALQRERRKQTLQKGRREMPEWVFISAD